MKSDRFYILWKNDMISQHTQNLQKLQNTLNYIYFLKTWLERSFSDFDVSNKKNVVETGIDEKEKSYFRMKNKADEGSFTETK